MIADLDMRVYFQTQKFIETEFGTPRAMGLALKLKRVKRTRRALRTHLNAWEDTE